MKLKIFAVLFLLAAYAAGCNNETSPVESKSVKDGALTSVYIQFENGSDTTLNYTKIEYNNIRGPRLFVYDGSNVTIYGMEDIRIVSF